MTVKFQKSRRWCFSVVHDAFGKHRILLASLALVLLPTLPAVVAAESIDAIDWGTYGFDNARTGFNPSETAISSSNVNTLTLKWSKNVLGRVTAQPLFASGVLVNGGPTDLVYVATEAGDLFALDASTGSQVWQQN